MIELISSTENPLRVRPYCNTCGWRKGGPDSWNGVACKCGHHEPPIVLQGHDRIAADRMWRDPDKRREFEAESGLTDSRCADYHDGFIEWAEKK